MTFMKKRSDPILMFTLIIILITASGTATVRDDNSSMEFGKVPVEQLTMTAFPTDTNAAVVILFDIGNATFDEHYELSFTRHTRIKILKKSGFDWGTVNIDYYTKDRTQDIDEIEGVTISTNAEGKVIKQELDDDAIFTEDVTESWKRKKFTLPSLSPGCVIEYQYTVRSSNPNYLPDWSFQTTEPCLWSEYEIKTPDRLAYASVSQGYLAFDIQTSVQEKESFLGPSGIEIVNMNHSHWLIKNAPAMREEPYITTLDDFKQRVTFQLAAVSWPGQAPRRILESWDKVAQELTDHLKFGKQLTSTLSIRRQVEKVCGFLSNPTEKVRAIYDFLRNTVVWNNHRWFIVTDDIEDLLETKSGNCADINLLLTQMLRDAGIQANPVLLSTRGNGKIQDAYPIVDQFDYVICQASAGGNTILLDATDRQRPMELLPQRALNYRGFLIDNGNYRWVNIKPNGKSSAAYLAECAITSDGLLNGKLQLKFKEYNAFSNRQLLAEQKPEDVIKSILKPNTYSITVDSFLINNKDTVTLPLIINAGISSNTYAQVLDSFIYVNPMTVNRTLENPFKQERRTFPVDFAYPINDTYTINLTLPDGYALKEFPQDVNVDLEGNIGSYRRKSQLTGKRFQLSTAFEINQVIVTPGQYSILRKFYEQIVALESEQLILQKEAVPVEVKAPPKPPAPKPSKKKK